MPTPVKLNDIYPRWLTGNGVLSNYLSKYTPEWAEGIDTAGKTAMDLEYHGNRSGDKLVSALIDKMLDGSNPDTFTDIMREMLSDVIHRLCSLNWDKQWATVSAEYNPIENYSMREQMTNDATVTTYGKQSTRTDNLTHAKTGTETRETAPDLETVTDKAMAGFNSATPVDTDKETQTTTGTQTDETTYNTQDTDTGTQSNVDSGSDTSTRNYVLTRSGNIGVTTSQQMLESERALWRWNFLQNVVFPDLDRIVTSPSYYIPDTDPIQSGYNYVTPYEGNADYKRY